MRGGVKGPEEILRRWLRDARRRLFDAITEDDVARIMVLVEQYRLVDPDDVRVRLVHARNLCLRRRFAEAEAELRAIEDGAGVLPESREDWRFVWTNAWAELWDQRGDAVACEAALRTHAACKPDETTGWIYFGSWLARQGRLDEAEAVHRQATTLRGDVDEAYLNLGLVLRAQGRLEESAEALQRALALCANYPEAQEALADVCAALALRQPSRA